MTNRTSPGAGEVAAYGAFAVLGGGDAYGTYRLATGLEDLTHQIDGIAQQACYNDPGMRAAAEEAVGRYVDQVDGVRASADVCSGIGSSSRGFFSSDAVSNIARNAITERAAHSSGRYADVLVGLGDRLSDSTYLISAVVGGVALTLAALFTARNLTSRRHWR